MAQLVLIALAGVCGLAAYAEAAKFEKLQGRGPGGVSARLCGLIATSAALVAARFAAPLLVASLTGYGGYVGATTFERQNRDRLFGVSSLLYAAACFFFGLFGALFVAASVWAIVCAFLALVGALLLARDENHASRAECERLRVENERLLASATRSHATQPQRSPDPPASRKTYLFGPPEAAGAPGDRRAPGQPAQPAAQPARWSQRTGGDDRTELLPNRTEARPRPNDDNDLLPGRR